MISVTDNFLSAEDLDKANTIISNKGFTFGWKSNMKNKDYMHWNCILGGSTTYSVVKEIAESEVDPFIWSIWNRINSTKRKLVRVYSNAYTYGTEGTLHKDSTHYESKTHMIYLNSKWQPDWAGETTFFNNDEISLAILPKPGRLIQFDGTIFHAARSVSRFCPEVRKVLVYKSIE